MEVTAKESGSFSDMDFSAQLTKIASTNPEVVFLPFYGEQASMILSRAASIGMDVTFLGGDGISNIVDFMTDKKLLTKVVYCDHFDANSETEIVKKFKADFKAKYGTDVTLSLRWSSARPSCAQAAPIRPRSLSRSRPVPSTALPARSPSTITTTRSRAPSS